MILHNHHICPECGSRRLRALTKRRSYHCPKCKKNFSITEEAIDVCFRCDRPLVDPIEQGELMGNGKWKCKRCRRVPRKEARHA